MIQNNRIIFSDNGVLSDASLVLNDFRSGTKTIAVVATQDYLYLGSDLPFNNRYIEVGTANTNTSVLSVDIYTGSVWEPAIDVIDETSVTGKTLAQSGHIWFTADKNGGGWGKRDTDDITELDDLVIYDLYWVRLKFSADLSVTTALSFIGQKFSTDSDLGGFYPELTLSETLAQWPSQPKTSYSEQHFLAAEEVIAELKRRYAIISESQLLNWELLRTASVHKCAEIIMNTYGKDWIEPKGEARKAFLEALKPPHLQIDKNKDAKLDYNERASSNCVVRR